MASRFGSDASYEPLTSTLTSLLFSVRNGRPGGSSLGGALTESGPFLVKTVDDKDHTGICINPWSWHRAANIMYFECPIAVGFTRGDPRIVDIPGFADELFGFYKLSQGLPRIQDQEALVRWREVSPVHRLRAPLLRNDLSANVYDAITPPSATLELCRVLLVSLPRRWHRRTRNWNDQWSIDGRLLLNWKHRCCLLTSD